MNGNIVCCLQGAPGPTGEPGEQGPAGDQVIRPKQNERVSECVRWRTQKRQNESNRRANEPISLHDHQQQQHHHLQHLQEPQEKQ